MVISAFSPASIWANATRTLSGMGTTTLTFPNTVFQTLAASSSLDMRPVSATTTGESTVSVVTGAAATGAMVIQLYDGTHAMQLAITAAAANSPAGFTCVQNSGTGLRVTNNDAAVAGNLMSAGWRLTQ